MTIDDVSEVCHADRQAHFNRQFFGQDSDWETRVRLQDLAWKEATAEMLDEIHTMLRQLTIESDGEPSE